MTSSPPSQNGLLSRKASWELLQSVASGSYAEVALERVYQKYSFSELDKGLVMELGYGSIRYRSLLDSWIDFLGKVPALKQPPLLRWLLHLGLYQILFMQKIPPSAAVHTTVELAKQSKILKLSHVVNGILRAAIRAKDAGKTPPTPFAFEAKLAQEQSLPLWLSKELVSWQGKDSAELIAQFFNQPPSIDIRINRLKADSETVCKMFLKVGIQSEYIDDCPYGLKIVSGQGDLRKWPGYDDGLWSVQDRSAQWVSPLIEPKPGDKILDICSAPGGKTSHLAELIGDFGEIWAVDRSETRLKKVAININRLGFNSIRFLHADGTSLLSEMPHLKGYFKRILLDAPCSGLGTLARNPDARWRVSPSMIKDMISLQSRLLKSVIPLLSSDGRIVYSTCTIHPDENINQIGNFLNLHSDFKLIQEKQIWPGQNNQGDGFFAAVIDKTN